MKSRRCWDMVNCSWMDGNEMVPRIRKFFRRHLFFTDHTTTAERILPQMFYIEHRYVVLIYFPHPPVNCSLAGSHSHRCCTIWGACGLSQRLWRGLEGAIGEGSVRYIGSTIYSFLRLNRTLELDVRCIVLRSYSTVQKGTRNW